MIPVCVVLLLLLLLRRPACAILRAMVESVFRGAAVLEERLGVVFIGLAGWLRQSGPPDPRSVLVGLLLVGLAAAVAYADYSVLLATLGLIWPTDVPPAWLAFSIVAVTAAVGMLTHLVSGLWARIALVVLACSLIGAQGTIAYVRTSQLATIRSVLEASAVTADDGALVIAGAQGAQSVAPLTGPTVNLPAVPAQHDQLGPTMAAGIATILCLAQIAAAWGAISFAGGFLPWVVASPALLALAIPWLALQMLSASGLRGGFPLALDALSAVLESTAQIPAKIAPFPWTDASLRQRLDRKRRALLAELQEKEDSETGKLRASVEQELRDAERAALREFIADAARQRRVFLSELLQEAFEASRGNLQGVSDSIVRMWFWPLDKAWRLVSIVRGDGQFPSRVDALCRDLDPNEPGEVRHD